MNTRENEKASLMERRWTITLRQGTTCTFLVLGPTKQVAAQISIETIPNGWRCSKVGEWVGLEVPAEINNAFVLEAVLEKVDDYTISDDARELLADLTNLPGWGEVEP